MVLLIKITKQPLKIRGIKKGGFKMKENKKINSIMWLTIGFSYIYFGYHIIKFLAGRYQ